MQDQQDIQSVKSWRAPELVELGDIANDTEHGGFTFIDGATSFGS